MYKRKSTFPKQMIKIELNKAYDTINWNFLRLLMIALQFPKEYVDRVMECLTITRFTIVNGECYGFFHARRGLRCEDPCLPHFLLW